MSNLSADPRAGRAGLLGLGLAVVALGLGWLVLRGEDRGARSGSAVAGGAVEPPAPGGRGEQLDPPSARRVDPGRSEPEVRTPPPDELEPFASTGYSLEGFRGRKGTLRGHVAVAGDGPFPLAWTLQLRPSLTAPARELAVTRTLAFEDGRREFEVRDLPLGGYDVFPEAEGFNGQVMALVLEPGNERPFVNLLLIPAGVLEGRVVDAAGEPAEDVWITLFRIEDGQPRETRTDDTGVFRFEALPDGPYELMVGRASSPLHRERRPLRFQAPRMTFPDIELPPLGELHVRVVDSWAEPIEGVEVRGSGTNGGIVEGVTDLDGTLVTRHLPEGRYRLRISHPGFEAEYARRFAVEVKPGEITEAPVRFGP